jgi:hypothetical protein
MFKRYKKQQLKRYEAVRKFFEASDKRFCNNLKEQLKNPTFTILKNELPIL